MKRIAAAFALGLLAWSAGARTWTSQSGSRVEAEFMEMQGDSVVLRNPEGRQFRIPLAQLSEGDQAFVRENHMSPPAEQTPEAVKPSPSAAATEAGPADSAAAWIVHAAPDPLSASQFPGLAATNLAQVMLVGLQFGPAKSDVLYCAFESPDPAQPPSKLYLYSPSAEGYTRTVALQGMRRKIEEARVSSFKDVRLKSAFGDLQVTANLEFVCGIGRSDTVLLMAAMQLERGGSAAAFLLGGYLNNDILYGAGALKVVPLLAKPELAVKTWMMRGPALTGFCQMGKLSLVPKTGMAATLAVEVAERESGRVLDKLKTEYLEKKMIAGQPDRTINLSLTLQQGKKVQIKSVADLGPFLGKAEKTSNFY